VGTPFIWCAFTFYAKQRNDVRALRRRESRRIQPDAWLQDLRLARVSHLTSSTDAELKARLLFKVIALLSPRTAVDECVHSLAG
jgi:hypothetical protein